MSAGTLVFVVVVILIVVMLARGPRRRQQDQQRMWDSLETGDQIVTAGGIYGEVTGFQDDDVLVRIAPSLEVRVARRAVAGVFKEDEDATGEPPEETVEPEPGDAQPR